MVSLIAVSIPLLLMGDVVGRLFRKFAVTLSVTILIATVVSLTLVPCAKLGLLLFMVKHSDKKQQMQNRLRPMTTISGLKIGCPGGEGPASLLLSTWRSHLCFRRLSLVRYILFVLMLLSR